MLEDGGSEMPSTVSENGSLYPPGMAFISCLSSCDSIDPPLVLECCFPTPPMLEGFLLRRFDRGLSMVDADDPDTRDGVRVLPATSNLGNRDDDICRAVLGAAICGHKWDIGTVGVWLP